MLIDKYYAFNYLIHKYINDLFDFAQSCLNIFKLLFKLHKLKSFFAYHFLGVVHV